MRPGACVAVTASILALAAPARAAPAPGLGTLAAGIAHEINNPLAYVTGNLEVAVEALADPALLPGPARDELTAVIHDAQDGAERVRKIVHGLRSFSRAEDEKLRPSA
jgi:signal transduction histidine kinase